ncbi:hypothetical protein BCR37DRAFT_381533 [Protomyces lactucae-debilis]|uniref:Uncharacterized protein n=1 Tax=Protomyces lactucae-debilis TaxID=2754530 RepID=A0A1Y2F7R6_PROLT|nr:uncharacterized protein BCR37DRAFT_381533 [Protomyces lactucae-debilis]ORY79396.1 hypothetical protein BCR37DRAFT_381533 [Protomyces lactucae-debilis]
MVSLQDELAALDSLDDTSSLYDLDAPTSEALMTTTSPDRPTAGRSLASEMSHGSLLDSAGCSQSHRQCTRQTNLLRLRTSLDTLKQHKRDTHSPNTLRQLLAEPSDYDGADYGDPADDSEPEETFPVLDAAIHSLQGFCTFDETASDADVVDRFTNALSELRPQSAVETVASRCIAAHESLAAAMPRKINALRDLAMQVAAGYLSVESVQDSQGEAVLLDQRLLREALNALDEVSRGLSRADRPTTSDSHVSHGSHGQGYGENAADKLNQLQTDTNALLLDLASLSDALSMLRQTSLSASRKLRTVRDQIEVMQQEQRMAEQSRLLLERDGWHAGAAQRIVARQCREICGGFEGTWQRLRGRLAASV